MSNIDEELNEDISSDNDENEIDTQEAEPELITIEQFKEALTNNTECKNYIDNLIEQEINNRYPKKTEAEIKFEKKQAELERAMEEKRQLELQIKYQSLMSENKLPLELLDFVAGKDVDETVSKIEKFNKIVEDLIEVHRQEWANKWIKECSYAPPGENGWASDEGKDLWKMLM